MKADILKLMKIISLIFFLVSGAASAVTPPSLPITYNGNTYSQAIRYHSPMYGDQTCYFQNGAIVAGYLPGWFWISHDRRYDPDSVCGGTYEWSGQLAIQLTATTVDCPANDNIWSSIALTVPSGWGSNYTQCEYTYSYGESFPSPKAVSFINFLFDDATAYTAGVSSVMDQSTLGSGTPYANNDQVESFEGEVGDVGPYNGSTCYRKANNTAFGNSFNYVGTTGTGGAYYLCYDGHPGYDYPKAHNTAIYAPADGTLCVATNITSQPSPANVWRDTVICPLPSVVTETWSGYHTIYMFHTECINGSTNNYLTVFLHNDDLETSVRSDIESNGYSVVSRSQQIAQVGDVGASGAYHVHFEVYKYNGTGWDRVDPYGDGTNNILWQH